MNLFDTVSADIKAAMLARDKVRLEALRGVKKESRKARLSTLSRTVRNLQKKSLHRQP